MSAKPAKKQSAKVTAKAASARLRNNVKFRRRWMTFLRMTRYGINNFSRNAWLTVAATAVMTITLLVILTTVTTQRVFVDTIDQLKSKVDISIFLKKEVTDKQAGELKKRLERLPNVSGVDYISAREAQQIYNDSESGDVSYLQDLSDIIQEQGVLVPASLQVRLKDLGQIEGLKNLVSNDKAFKEAVSTDNPPSYEGKQVAIDNIARAMVFAQRAGIGISIVFTIVSVMIIFNTIRMAIFNRREEIQMMKLIGADRSFIRGPFIVEAAMYGFFAAVLAVGLIYLAVYIAQGPLSQYGIVVEPTLRAMESQPGLVVLAAIAVGALIGVISSQLAVRRYLKV